MRRQNLFRIMMLYFNLAVIVGQRRILNGTMIEEFEEKRYVVYLAKSRVSPMIYDAWVCGGALVTTEYIITSAACVEDVRHLYAIAGYKKYVTDIYTDTCANFTKKKIVFSCIPKSYNLDYEKLEVWSFIDIAVVKVESPYNFELADEEYKKHQCDYTPRAIQVNYEDKFQEPDVDAIVLGWGHKDKWRKDGDHNNYNQETLHYASILIADKEECKRHYKNYTGMERVIDDYMICSMGEGNINSQGLLKVTSPPVNGCANTTTDDSVPHMLAFEEPTCRYGTGEGDIVFVENTRKQTVLNVTDKVEDNATIVEMFKRNNKTNNTFENVNTRRHGICQNDHGGPIVTWVGAHEVLIGVASVFKVSRDFDCMGPFLYTSTQCSGAFLNCILTSGDSSTSSRKAICDAPPKERGFDKVETTISWKDHPDGPADNERYLVRPLYPQFAI